MLKLLTDRAKQAHKKAQSLYGGWAFLYFTSVCYQLRFSDLSVRCHLELQ